jgi:hypothetical protein
VVSAVVLSNIQRATNYVLCVVRCSAALFFAGISSRIGSQRVRAVVLGIGCVVLVGALAWVLTFPISFSV